MMRDLFADAPHLFLRESKFQLQLPTKPIRTKPISSHHTTSRNMAPMLARRQHRAKPLGWYLRLRLDTELISSQSNFNLK